MPRAKKAAKIRSTSSSPKKARYRGSEKRMAVGSPGARHRASSPRSSSSAKFATDTAGRASATTGSSPHVTERVARHYGISRDRVAARFIEEGFLEWMADESEKIWNDPNRAQFKSVQGRCHGPVDEAVKILVFAIDAMAIRPPAPVPPMLTPKQQEARLEYRRKKVDAFNKLPPEEQERILAKKRHRERNRPERIVERVIAAYAAEEGQTAEDALMEIQRIGVFDLLVNGIKTRKDAAKATQILDATAKMYERIGPKVIRLLKRCRTGEAVEARDADKLIR